MSRYRPMVLPDDTPSPFAEALLSGLERGPERLRQRRQDQAAEEERGFRREDREADRERRERLGPLEEALLRGQAVERGIVPESQVPLADMIEEPNIGADLLSGRARFGDQGIGMPKVEREDNSMGFRSPGSFNPMSGTFNPPRMPAPRRVPLGGGYELDPSLTTEGRKEAQIRRQVDLAVGRGIPAEEAELEIRGGGLSSEHFHPGPFHPRTVAEALDFEKQLIRARGDEDVRVAGARAAGTHTRAREDLTRVERQVDDNRADLSAAEREKPDLSQYLLQGKTVADYKNALADRQQRISALRQRGDSLGVVRDDLAARVQGRPGGSDGDTGRARARAQELQREGKSRAEILRILQSEGFNVQ